MEITLRIVQMPTGKLESGQKEIRTAGMNASQRPAPLLPAAGGRSD